MTATVDVVIAGDDGTARRAAVRALQRGERVLVVLRSVDARRARRLRTSLLEAAGADRDQLRVLAGAEVVCADGIDGVEAVVVRHAPSGRLSAVNASAFVSFARRTGDRRAVVTRPSPEWEQGRGSSIWRWRRLCEQSTRETSDETGTRVRSLREPSS